MVAELPVGCRWRRPTLDDADEIFGLVAERNTALVGFADVTVAEVRDELTEPGFDPDVDGWLVPGGAAEVTGYGWAMGKGTSDMVDVDVIARDAVADWLWAQVLTRASEMGAQADHRTVRVDIGIYPADLDQQGARSGSCQRRRSNGCASTSPSHPVSRWCRLMWSCAAVRAMRNCGATDMACG